MSNESRKSPVWTAWNKFVEGPSDGDASDGSVADTPSRAETISAGELFDLKKTMQRNRILHSYSGYMNEAVLLGVGDAIKRTIGFDEQPTRVARSVFGVFVEQMQNIIRYSTETLPEEETESSDFRYGILAIGLADGGYLVASGNQIRKSDKERIRSQLEVLQKSSPDELKKMYREKIHAGPDPGSKGASIGLIEIARRATRPIEFEFFDVNDTQTFFALKVII